MMTLNVLTDNIIETLEGISGEICDKYCKFWSEYSKKDNFDSDMEEELEKKHCQFCPLGCGKTWKPKQK